MLGMNNVRLSMIGQRIAKQSPSNGHLVIKSPIMTLPKIYARKPLIIAITTRLQPEARAKTPRSDFAHKLKSCAFYAAHRGEINRIAIDHGAPVAPLRKNAKSVAKRVWVEVLAPDPGPCRAVGEQWRLLAFA